MRIIALDIATSTGVAIGNSGDAPVCRSEDLGKGQSEDVRLSRALALTDQLVRLYEPDLIAVEAAIGGREASQYLVGLVACVRACATNRGVPVETYHLASIRKHFLGKALGVRDFPGMSKAKAKMAIKQKVMDRCRLLGWEVPDHDAADAAALWDYACAKHGAQTAPSGKLFHAG